MSDYFSDNYDDNYDDSASKGWSERDWMNYAKRSESEISKFAAIYSVGKLKGMQLEEIAKMAGWSIVDTEEYPSADAPYEASFDAEFADEPWTLINHPVYVVARALMKCLQEHFGRIVDETNMNPKDVWEIEKCLNEMSTQMLLAISSEDLGEDTLARCKYKIAIFGVNEAIAKLAKIPEPKSEFGKERVRRINSIIFDLRQLCITLLETPQTKKRQ